ncbi:MAG: hypothetical protein JSU00_06325 [Acidobacteria bacterium]|nr:hypothetical protein [Acidobacteriota bacterium]
MTWNSLQILNRLGLWFPAAICMLLVSLSACADVEFAASGWLLAARFLSLPVGRRQ